MQLSAQHLAEVVEAIRTREDAAAASDKRRHSRINLVTRVDVLNHADGRAYTALTRDLSREGAGLIQSVPMTAGQQLTLSLPRLRGRPLSVQCTVMHVRALADGVWGVGMRFAALIPDPAAGPDAAEVARIARTMLGQ